MQEHTYWYASALDKLGRAYHHAEQLAERTARYLDSDPFTIVREERDGDTHYLLKMPFPVPSDLTLMAGDAIQNARASLGHLVSALAALNGKGDAKFPIKDTKNDYLKARGFLEQRIGKKATSAIDRTRPYKEGNRRLWLLHRLNVIDKHRMLVSVVTSSNATRIKLGPHLPGQTIDLRGHWGPDARDIVLSIPPDVRFNFGPADHDTVLLAVKGEESFELDPTFDLALCLHEPGLTDYDPLVATVESLVEAAGDAIGALVDKVGPHPRL